MFLHRLRKSGKPESEGTESVGPVVGAAGADDVVKVAEMDFISGVDSGAAVGAAEDNKRVVVHLRRSFAAAKTLRSARL